MQKFKDRISWLLLIGIFPLAILTEAVLVYSAWRKSDIERLELETKTEILHRLNASHPAPTAENLSAAGIHHKALSTRLQTLKSKLAQGVISTEELQKHFSEPQDLYFDLVKFVENYRRKAQVKGISIRENENFAFGELLNQTAEFHFASAAQIYRQRLVLGRLLNLLFDSSPLRLEAVQRQPVPPVDGKIKSHLGNKFKGDFFTLEESANGSRHALTNHFAIKLAFTGRTENLRRFLNQVSNLEIPLRVRAVEVFPIDQVKALGGSIKRAVFTDSFGIFDEADPRRPDGGPIPIVKENTSLFTVVLQYFDITINDEDGKNQRIAESVKPISWPEPPSQSWDAEAIFEIFSPPKIFYNRQANTFVLKPPLNTTPSAEAFGLELIGFSRRPYRIQYKGFAGQAGNYHILLRNEESGADLRVKVGDILGEEKISVIDFNVDRRMTFKPEGSPLLIESVNLQLFDARLGEKITLGPGPRYSLSDKAVFRTVGPSPETITLGPGQNYLLGDATYALEIVDIEKKSVVMQKKTAASDFSELRILVLKDATTPAEATSSGTSEKTMALENLQKKIN